MRRMTMVVAVLALAACRGPDGGDAEGPQPAPDVSRPTASSTNPPSSAATTSTVLVATTSTVRAAPGPTLPPPTTVPPTVPPTLAPAPTAPESPPTTAPALLRRGDRGPAVAELEARLAGLGYWPGDADGSFDQRTEQAVYAFQKSQGLAVDGVAGPEVAAALAAPAPIGSRFAEPDGVEVDLDRQIVIFVRDGRPFLVLNTSTGTDEPYQHPTQGLQRADTPVGRFTVTWQVDGVSEGELGPLYRPKFFHPDGIAVHGYDEVPPVPVSHGCVRVTPAAMDLIWSLDLMPIGSVVLVHGTPPT